MNMKPLASLSSHLVKRLLECQRTTLLGPHRFLHAGNLRGGGYPLLTSLKHQHQSLQFDPLVRRSFHVTTCLGELRTYEPDGKTTVSILNDEHGAPLMIDTYTQQGFKLNNGMKVLGPMIIFPRTVLGWDVGGIQDITPESLTIFSILEPKPDVLVIGVGDRGAKLSLDVVKFLRGKKINIEVLATDNACQTFNFLSVEGRRCAAVLVPPTSIRWTAQDLANNKKKKRIIYDEEFDESPFEPSPKEKGADSKPNPPTSSSNDKGDSKNPRDS